MSTPLSAMSSEMTTPETSEHRTALDAAYASFEVEAEKLSDLLAEVYKVMSELNTNTSTDMSVMTGRLASTTVRLLRDRLNNFENEGGIAPRPDLDIFSKILTLEESIAERVEMMIRIGKEELASQSFIEKLKDEQEEPSKGPKPTSKGVATGKESVKIAKSKTYSEASVGTDAGGTTAKAVATGVKEKKTEASMKLKSGEKTTVTSEETARTAKKAKSTDSDKSVIEEPRMAAKNKDLKAGVCKVKLISGLKFGLGVQLLHQGRAHLVTVCKSTAKEIYGETTDGTEVHITPSEAYMEGNHCNFGCKVKIGKAAWIQAACDKALFKVFEKKLTCLKAATRLTGSIANRFMKQFSPTTSVTPSTAEGPQAVNRAVPVGGTDKKAEGPKKAEAPKSGFVGDKPSEATKKELDLQKAIEAILQGQSEFKAELQEMKTRMEEMSASTSDSSKQARSAKTTL